MIATTIEQSKRLLKAEIDPNTADMCYLEEFITEGIGCVPYKRAWTKYPCVDTHEDHDGPDPVSFPAWSLSALITLCPEHVPYRIIRTRGKDIEGIFEDLVEFLCRKK